MLLLLFSFLLFDQILKLFIFSMNILVLLKKLFFYLLKLFHDLFHLNIFLKHDIILL